MFLIKDILQMTKSIRNIFGGNLLNRMINKFCSFEKYFGLIFSAYSMHYDSLAVTNRFEKSGNPLNELSISNAFTPSLNIRQKYSMSDKFYCHDLTLQSILFREILGLA